MIRSLVVTSVLSDILKLKRDKMKLKIGVIGTGHLGRIHAKLFREIRNSELTAVFDKDTEKAKMVGIEFGIPVCDNIGQLLESVDAVTIAATTSAHYNLAKECLNANKHVFIEKPITALISEAEEIVRLADDKDLTLQVGHVERFNPAILSLEKYNLDPKFIQTDRLAQFNPRGTDVAVVLDLMIHDIDIILSLVKSNVINVEASGVAVVSDNLDIANARLQFENGAVANVTASRISQKRMRKMRIFQQENYISVDFDSGISEVFRLVPSIEPVDPATISFGEIGVGDKRKRIIYEQPEIRQVNAIKYELELFADAVLNKKKPVVSGADGLRALKVADMIINKIKQSDLR